MSDDIHPLSLTGERTVPGIPAENYWFRRHEAAYRHAVPLVAGARLLEVGCGEGYGTAVLADSAASVIGVDYDAATVAHAAATYPRPQFLRANLAALPISTASVDVLATLQVIEHVWDHNQFVRECLRVLRPGGLLFVTTPNRLTFSPGRDEPLNPFHTKEFDARELEALLSANGFATELVYGVHPGPRLAELDARHHGLVAAQLAVPPEQWRPKLRDDVTSLVAADFPVLPATARDVNDSLDLVILARRP